MVAKRNKQKERHFTPFSCTHHSVTDQETFKPLSEEPVPTPTKRQTGRYLAVPVMNKVHDINDIKGKSQEQEEENVQR